MAPPQHSRPTVARPVRAPGAGPGRRPRYASASKGQGRRGEKSRMDETRELLRHTADVAASFLDTVGERPVGRPVEVDTLRAALGGPLPQRPTPAAAVIDALAAAVDPRLVATARPRHFCFVLGGSGPAALAHDWPTSARGQ